MKQLKYFIGGIATVVLFLPIAERFLELIELWIDVLMTNPKEKLLNHKINMQTKKEFLKPSPRIYDEDDCDDDGYEDYEE